MTINIFRVALNNLNRSVKLSRSFHSTSIRMAVVGDSLPPIELTEGNPGNKVNIKDLCAKKTVVIFGVPGAFTPGCSKTHLPGYVSKYDELKKKGVDELICVAVNDAFVMDAWAKEHKTEGKVRMLADADASFTKALNLGVDLPPLGGLRSKRYSMVVENCVIKSLKVEPDSTGLTCSLADRIEL